MYVKDLITYEKVRTQNQVDDLKTFASSIDHDITALDLMSPILNIFWNKRLIGYVKIMNNMVGFTAWSQDEDIPPRIFHKAFSEVIAWAKVNAELTNQIHPGFVAKGDDSPIQDGFLERAGLSDSGFRLFNIVT
jgi:hypothetical protein